MTADTSQKDGLPTFNFAEFAVKYKGGVSAEECHALSRFAGQLTDNCIVEIGSFRGKSAVALAHGLRDRSSATEPHIYCIEPHEPFVGVLGGQFGPQDRAHFYQIMLDTSYFERVSLVNLPSAQASIGWRKPIGLLFVDGDHSYCGVKSDFLCWSKHVVEGGIIAFDDSRRPDLGPTKLVGQLLQEGNFENVETVGKITFLRKLDSAFGRLA